MEQYLTKEDCIRKGFVRTEDGMYRKLNTLERYANSGWLDFGDKRYSAVDRVSAGCRLERDYYLARLETVCANDIRKVKVDGHGSAVLPESVLDARDRFNKACKAIPHEFWDIVVRVCCEDKGFILNGESDRKKVYSKHRQAMVLCLGLDRLIEHYRSRHDTY